MSLDGSWKVVVRKTRRSRWVDLSRYPGFKRNRSAKGLEWSRAGLTEEEARGFAAKAREDRLACEVLDERFERSTGYRAEYIARHPGPWRCRYCHRRLSDVGDMTVDHIVPVAAASASQKAPLRRAFARWALEREGARSVNDDANLCPACKHCNSSKGQKLGLWVARGWLGRFAPYWVLLRCAQIALVLLVVCALAAYGPYALARLARACVHAGVFR